MPRHVSRPAVPPALPHGPRADTEQSPTRPRSGRKTPARQLVLAAAAVVLAGCGTAESSRAAEPPTLPSVPADWWHTAPRTDEQKAEVAARARQIDVCALVPRSELAAFGEVRTVDNDQTDSCRVAFTSNGAVDKLSWASMVLFGDVPRFPGYTETQLGDVSLSILPGDEAEGATQKTCNATARFRSGAALYFQITTPSAIDGCARLTALAGATVQRWLTAPPQGTSPDTRRTALHGADPCAVRGRLGGTGDVGVPTITGCGFTYRGVDVVISYKLLERGFLSKTEQEIDGRTVHMGDTSLVAVVGPELPPGPTGLGGNVVPVVDVFADAEDVAKDVMRQLLPLFPPA